MASKPSTVRVSLTPAPGFCIKSSALQPAVCKITTSPSQPATKLDGSIPGTLTIPKGIKIFVNIAWDANVPPPPEGSEEAIQKAMTGEEPDVDDEEQWFVPVVVSEPRSAVDKAGKSSIVFDCVYNSSLKSRCLRDHAFRAFLVELGLQRIEAQHSVLLSRQLGTPNIASKGKLHPRTALVPLALFPEAHPVRADGENKKLIEEIEPQMKVSGNARSDQRAKPEGPAPAPKSILKSTPAPTKASPEKCEAVQESEGRPKFEWAKDGEHIKITVFVPRLTYEHIRTATLDVEERRIILNIPPFYSLDVDVSLPDAQLVSIFGSQSGDDSVLMLKRQRDFDVDGAQAAWRVADGVVTIHV